MIPQSPQFPLNTKWGRNITLSKTNNNQPKIWIADILLLFTCKGFELILEIKCLFANCCQIYLESGADGKLLNGSADLKDLICSSLLCWTYMNKYQCYSTLNCIAFAYYVSAYQHIHCPLYSCAFFSYTVCVDKLPTLCHQTPSGPVYVSEFFCNTIFHLASAPACSPLSSYHTSVCHVELNAKVSIRSPRVMAGSEDDATDSFVFPDYTRDGRCGHYPKVSNDRSVATRCSISSLGSKS